jgi:hypothetical protein
MGNSVPRYNSVLYGTTVCTCAGIYKQLPLFFKLSDSYYASLSET